DRHRAATPPRADWSCPRRCRRRAPRGSHRGSPPPARNSGNWSASALAQRAVTRPKRLPPSPHVQPARDIRSGPPSYPHRHEHIESGCILAVADHGGRARIGELELGGAAFELPRDVEQVAGVKSDLERIEAILDGDLFARTAAVRIVDRKGELAVGDGELHRAALVARQR